MITNDAVLNPGWNVNVEEKQNGQDIKIDGTVTVAVEVTMNGQDFSSQGIVYNYLPIITVTGVIPTHGPIKGGTEVIVIGTGFIRSSLLACQFGEGRSQVVKAAHFFNDTRIICIAPLVLMI
jgi:hypothetical protein